MKKILIKEKDYNFIQNVLIKEENHELYGKKYSLDKMTKDLLGSMQNKSKFVEELLRKQYITYQNLKYIKHSIENGDDPDYYGGDIILSFIDDTLKKDRESIKNSKKIKSSVLDNQYIKTHEKNNLVPKL